MHDNSKDLENMIFKKYTVSFSCFPFARDARVKELFAEIQR